MKTNHSDAFLLFYYPICGKLSKAWTTNRVPRATCLCAVSSQQVPTKAAVTLTLEELDLDAAASQVRCLYHSQLVCDFLAHAMLLEHVIANSVAVVVVVVNTY